MSKLNRRGFLSFLGAAPVVAPSVLQAAAADMAKVEAMPAATVSVKGSADFLSRRLHIVASCGYSPTDMNREFRKLMAERDA